MDLDLDFGEGAGKEREKWEIEEREERKMGGEEKKINFYLKVNRFFVEAFCSTPPTYSNDSLSPTNHHNGLGSSKTLKTNLEKT